MDKYRELHIDWTNCSNKNIYDDVTDFHYGGLMQYKQLATN